MGTHAVFVYEEVKVQHYAVNYSMLHGWACATLHPTQIIHIHYRLKSFKFLTGYN